MKVKITAQTRLCVRRKVQKMSKVVVMDHPLIQHKIGIIRREETGSKDFRTLVSEIAMLMCYEATRDLKLTDVEINTPICKTTVKELKGKKACRCSDLTRRTRHGGRYAQHDPGGKGRTHRIIP